MSADSLPAPPAECPAPQWYYLDIGNICNLSCPYCPTGNGKTLTRDKGLMSRETFDIILWNRPDLHSQDPFARGDIVDARRANIDERKFRLRLPAIRGFEREML